MIRSTTRRARLSDVRHWAIPANERRPTIAAARRSPTPITNPAPMTKLFARGEPAANDSMITSSITYESAILDPTVHAA